jgi:hypothetical protein
VNTPLPINFEKVVLEDQILAEIIWSSIEIEKTTFFSNESSPIQIGIMLHRNNFIEPPHTHPMQIRPSTETQQAFVVLEGQIEVDFFTSKGELFRTVVLNKNDSILIISGMHRIRVKEFSKCFTVKQGPFDVNNDKIEFSGDLID